MFSLNMNHSLQETTGGEALMRSRMHAMEQLEREILAGLGFDDPYR